MKIGDVIRKYRKHSGMTQEEMAKCLGVSTPAVNKWENNNTLPDVALLAPIARLLNITTDELLSFHKELTTEEINQFLSQIQKDLKEKDYEDVFLFAKTILQEYPNCESLIWQTALILDVHRMMKNPEDKANYEDTILEWYERCLRSKHKQMRMQAADSLFHFYYRKEDYEKALHYTEFFDRENPKRKRKEALVYSKTGRKEAAYRTYEELLFSSYQHIQMTLNDLRILYMEDDDQEMVHKLVKIASMTASAFEMGKYYEVSVEFDVAAWEKDAVKTARILQDILENLETIKDFTKSKLYRHMAFKNNEANFTDDFRKELLQSLEDETFHYMQGNAYWEELKASVKEMK